MKFRKDINDLRAFVVIAVVLFHFNAAWMSDGLDRVRLKFIWHIMMKPQCIIFNRFFYYI